MTSCAVVIPVYRERLSSDEEYSVRVSLSNLAGHDVFWIGPRSLDTSYYEENFPVRLLRRYDDAYFSSVEGYSRLLVQEKFYENFSNYEHVLICQTDAIVLRPDLGKWLDGPFDYLGAPWPSGYSLQLQVPELPVKGPIRCNAFVGNGGLSLRRVESCISLIREFKSVSSEWASRGHAEDLYFGFLGNLSRRFVLPNVVTAAHFSHDIDPGYLQQLIGGEVPLGVHAWGKYDRDLWEGILGALPAGAPPNPLPPEA
jgi:Protein of unknown function (DUF5672)